MMIWTCNLGIGEAEEDQQFEACLGYMKHCFRQE